MKLTIAAIIVSILTALVVGLPGHPDTSKRQLVKYPGEYDGDDAE